MPTSESRTARGLGLTTSAWHVTLLLTTRCESPTGELECHFVYCLVGTFNAGEGRLVSINDVPVAASTTFILYDDTDH